jgi:hypothetical protein
MCQKYAEGCDCASCLAREEALTDDIIHWMWETYYEPPSLPYQRIDGFSRILRFPVVSLRRDSGSADDQPEQGPR